MKKGQGKCNHCTIIADMPTLARLSTATIAMYAADHLPPHFHVRVNDGREALVEIATLTVLPSAPA